MATTVTTHTSIPPVALTGQVSWGDTNSPGGGHTQGTSGSSIPSEEVKGGADTNVLLAALDKADWKPKLDVFSSLIREQCMALAPSEAVVFKQTLKDFLFLSAHNTIKAMSPTERALITTEHDLEKNIPSLKAFSWVLPNESAYLGMRRHVFAALQSWDTQGGAKAADTTHLEETFNGSLKQFLGLLNDRGRFVAPPASPLVGALVSNTDSDVGRTRRDPGEQARFRRDAPLAQANVGDELEGQIVGYGGGEKGSQQQDEQSHAQDEDEEDNETLKVKSARKEHEAAPQGTSTFISMQYLIKDFLSSVCGGKYSDLILYVQTIVFKAVRYFDYCIKTLNDTMGCQVKILDQIVVALERVSVLQKVADEFYPGYKEDVVQAGAALPAIQQGQTTVSLQVMFTDHQGVARNLWDFASGGCLTCNPIPPSFLDHEDFNTGTAVTQAGLDVLTKSWENVLQGNSAVWNLMADMSDNVLAFKDGSRMNIGRWLLENDIVTNEDDLRHYTVSSLPEVLRMNAQQVSGLNSKSLSKMQVLIGERENLMGQYSALARVDRDFKAHITQNL